MSVYTAAVITVSDRGFAGERRDTAGPACIRLLKEIGFETVYTALVPDETDCIKRELLHCVDELDISLVLTCGGTGFSKRDVSPEAAEAVFDRRADGFAEAMRAESLRITPKAALSRAVSGLRNESIIITLPGSEKAAVENLSAVKLSLKHGVDMARSSGSADCAGREKSSPEISRWLSEAKSAARAADCGMYLIHNGVVRSSSKKEAHGEGKYPKVSGMELSYDRAKLELLVSEAEKQNGIGFVRAWINEGRLAVGDDIMYVMVGGDTGENVRAGLTALVKRIKSECVFEKEL